MQFSTFAILAGLSAMAAATPVYNVETVVDLKATIDLTCDDMPPSTVTQTVTVTAPPAPPATMVPAPPMTQAPPPTTWYTSGGASTSIAYNGPASTIYVCPTGASNHQCSKTVYKNNVIIENVIIIIDVQIIQNTPVTVTSTVTTGVVTATPPPPPPPASSTASQGSTSTASSSSSSATHLIQVGVDGLLAYGPNQLNAAVGDVLRFEFLKLNHTVTRSTFAQPCTPLVGAGAFDTGFTHFNPNNETSSAFFQEFTVDTAAPSWFYCRQIIANSPATHCSKGMVLGVNPGDKFDAFLKNAESTGSGSNSTVTSATVSKMASSTPVPSKTMTWYA
jgi:plastocyanin